MGLGYLHGLGISHGDAESKNLASDRKGIRVVDLETAKFIPKDEAKAVAATRNDIETFIDSTIQVDENRELVGKILNRKNAASDFAKYYRLGLRAAHQDSQIAPPQLPTASDAYFNATIDHARAVASHRPN